MSVPNATLENSGLSTSPIPQRNNAPITAPSEINKIFIFTPKIRWELNSSHP